jgi:aspartate racemase
MDKMKNDGAEGIILGCTEIGLLIKEYPLSLYDSTIIHANKAAEFCLS